MKKKQGRFSKVRSCEYYGILKGSLYKKKLKLLYKKERVTIFIVMNGWVHLKGQETKIA